MAGLRANNALKTAESKKREAQKRLDDMKLSCVDSNFLLEFSKTHNLSKSCRIVGVSRGYGRKLLEKPESVLAIEWYTTLLSAYTAINPALIAGRMALWANINPADFYDSAGNARPLSELTREQASCIKSVDVKFDKFGERHIVFKFFDAKTATESIARAYALFDKPSDENLSELDDMTEEQLEDFLANCEVVEPLERLENEKQPFYTIDKKG